MRRDYGDWKPAMDALIGRIERGDWRHGIKTKDATRELLRLARFPSDESQLWAPRFKKRCGDFLQHALYYYVQSSLKNRRFLFEGASGAKYRLRSVHNVEHGNGHGELDADGLAPAPDKEGLWMRDDDMHRADVLLVRGMYSRRGRQSGSDIRYLDLADAALVHRPGDAVVGDVRDEIRAAM